MKKRISLLIATFIMVVNMITPIPNFSYTDVVLQLRWKDQFQFAGYYMAQEKGYYEDEGLNVEIRNAFNENGEIRFAVNEVLEGRSEFGIGSIDLLQSEAKTNEICLVSTMFQNFPVSYVMLVDTEYEGIKNVNHINILRRENDILDIPLQSMMLRKGVIPDNTKITDKSYFAEFKDLISGKYEILPSYLGTMENQANIYNVNIKRIIPEDYGVNYPGDSIFTSKEYAKKNPKIVEKFRRASIKGWEYALANSDETIKYIVEEKELQNLTSEEFKMFNKSQEKEIRGRMEKEEVKFGFINKQNWKVTNENLKALEIIRQDSNLEGFFFEYEELLAYKARKKQINILKSIAAIAVIGAIIILITKRGRGKKHDEKDI